MLKPRPYQAESVDAVNSALRERDDNPALVLPTGAGKSFVMALLLHGWLEKAPALRAMVLAHRKELVEQNAAELLGIDPTLSVGVFAASLKRRETAQSIIFASIDSVAHNADQMPPMDVLLIDEAHRIPVRGEGKYRKFIDAMRAKNSALRVVGLTATPYRMGTGPICHRDHILNHVCYEAHVSDLIAKGYLCPIRTIDGEHKKLNLDGVKKTAGEFNVKDLALRVDKNEVIAEAVRDMVHNANAHNRKSIIVFCINVEHCKHVQQALRSYGIDAPYIVGATKMSERERIIDAFKDGKHRFLLSVDCFFEGFNAKRVDCVAMLRPTQSKGLWVQAIGRGLRLHPDKEFCLVLDYGNNIQLHGPIDLPEGSEVKLAQCNDCGNHFSRAVRKCPSCGWEIPPQQREMFEREEQAERAMHEAKAAHGKLLNEAQWLDVHGVQFRLHKKVGKPDSVRAEFYCGVGQLVNKWLLLDHGAYGRGEAQKFLSRFGLPNYESSKSMIDDAPNASKLVMQKLKQIQIQYDGKFLAVKDYR